MTTAATDRAPIPNAAHLAHLQENARPTAPWYPPLEDVTRPMLTTREAAFYLNRAEQTLRCWSMADNGPVRPIHINGRLGWPVSEVRRLLGVAS